MNPQPPPPPGSLRQLYDRARSELGQMLEQIETREKDARQATSQLTHRIEDKMSHDRQRIEQSLLHRYGVFAIGGGLRRRMVLRDVAELDGREPLHTTSDFAEALLLAGSRLDDPVLRPRLPVDPGELARLVHQLLRELQHIETVNARLGGSGTSDDPHVVAPGECLHIDGASTLGLQQVAPDRLVLLPRGRRLYLAARTASAP
jgi:hypothetical protein